MSPFTNAAYVSSGNDEQRSIPEILDIVRDIVSRKIEFIRSIQMEVSNEANETPIPITVYLFTLNSDSTEKTLITTPCIKEEFNLQTEIIPFNIPFNIPGW